MDLPYIIFRLLLIWPNSMKKKLKPVTYRLGTSVPPVKLVESQVKGQTVEIQADDIVIYGSADPETYPLQKKVIHWNFAWNSPFAPLCTTFWSCVPFYVTTWPLLFINLFTTVDFLFPHAHYHRFGCRGCRTDVSGYYPWPGKYQVDRGWKSGSFSDDFLWQTGQSHRFRTTKANLPLWRWEQFNIWPTFPAENSNTASPVGILGWLNRKWHSTK